MCLDNLFDNVYHLLDKAYAGGFVEHAIEPSIIIQVDSRAECPGY